MNLNDILNEWDKDAPISTTDLDQNIDSIPRLHRKYLRMYANESLILRKNESDFRVLRHQKWEFYTQGPNEETKKKGWKLPDKGMIFKPEAGGYIETDPDIVELQLKIDFQKQKVEALKHIMDHIQYRNNIITNKIAWQKFTGGEG